MFAKTNKFGNRYKIDTKKPPIKVADNECHIGVKWINTFLGGRFQT